MEALSPPIELLERVMEAEPQISRVVRTLQSIYVRIDWFSLGSGMKVWSGGFQGQHSSPLR